MSTDIAETPGVEFDGYAKEPPGGEWEYVVDDFGVTYQAGAWPFDRPGTDLDDYYRGFRKHGLPLPAQGCGVFSIRLSPDAGYEHVSRNEHVSVWPDWADASKATADLHVWVRAQGMGGYVRFCVARLDLNAGTFALDWGRHPAVCEDQAAAKARKVLAFLAGEAARRDSGHAAPVTAYGKWLAEVGCAMHAGYPDDSPAVRACGVCAAHRQVTAST